MENWKKQFPDDWDEKLYKKDGHFLQSSAWGEFQYESGKEIFMANGEGWQCLAIVEPTKFGNRLYCPYGPVVVDKKSFDAAIKALRRLARQINSIYIRIEPTKNISQGDLKTSGLIEAAHDVQPRLTWVKNLSKTDEELIAEMSATNRNLHRTAAKKGISFRSSRNPADMAIFLDMIHDVARQTGITPHPDEYYQTMAEVLLPKGGATIYIAETQKKPIAAAFVYDSPIVRYYAHAGALHEFRKLHAGSPLLSQMILDAKKQNKKEFDFVGVAPPDQPDHKWAGFSRFKQSFGGEYKEYLGTWELPVDKLKYSAYQIMFKAYKLLRK